MARKTNSERIAVCETEITNMKEIIKEVCTNDIPHIYSELGKITTFLAESKAVFAKVGENTKLLGTLDEKLDSVTLALKGIHNQEALGKREKASIAVALIVSIAGIVIAFLK